MNISRRSFIKKGGLMLAAVSVTGINPFEKSKVIRVLILGDSISMGYTPEVKEMMKDEAYVEHPKENCQGTKLGVQRIDQWIGSEPWDVIHFNFGLHDLKHVDPVTGVNSEKPEDPQQSDLKQYKANLKIIVKRLKQTGSKLVFATSTPYPDKPQGPLRRAEDVVAYNQVALKIMKKNKIKVNDLYAYILPDLATLQLPKNVHFKKQGSVALGKKVVEAIRESMSQ